MTGSSGSRSYRGLVADGPFPTISNGRSQSSKTGIADEPSGPLRGCVLECHTRMSINENGVPITRHETSEDRWTIGVQETFSEWF